ncbi:MAG: response regulator [Spirochaetales bacterium]|nr:response regulator [Spirochaetales bacterium]
MIYKFMKNSKKETKKTVLLIDNDQLWIDNVKNYLELLDYRVVFLKIPEEKKFLHPVLRTRNIDVIVSEIKMPGLDGFTVAKNIREKFGSRFKILLTAKTIKDNDKFQASKAMVDSLVLKTRDRTTLKSEIERLARHSG